MELTISVAFQQSEDLWKLLAETGLSKAELFSERPELISIYNDYLSWCPLCEYSIREFNRIHQTGSSDERCQYCPVPELECEETDSIFTKWAFSKNRENKKQYAHNILCMIREASQKIKNEEK